MRDGKTGWVRRGALAALLGAAIALGIGAAARATSVQEFVRIRGQGESILQGFGLVVGLPGTGDQGKDLIVARPLAELLRSSGNPIGSLEDLAKSKSAAIVMVTCVVGRDGGKIDDRVDVTVSAVNNPKSLTGGELFLTPLRGPLPGQGVYAIAQGPLMIEGTSQNRARVMGGARLTQNINMPSVDADGTVTLIVEPHAAGWTTAQLLSSVINDHRVGLDDRAEEIAVAMDERSVRIKIPSAELADPANFIADILSIRFDPSLLTLPARVLVNEREGVIVVTGEVEISPVIITHNDLVITTVTPPPVASPDAPLIEREAWTRLNTTGRPSDMARLEDLLKAFKQLNVPVGDQIAILSKLHKTGRLHAALVVD